MSATDWAALAVAGLSILAAVAGVARWLIKAYLAELRPDGNGGDNLRGRIDRIENRVDRIYEILIEDRLAK